MGVRENLIRIGERVRAAARRAGRDPAGVRIIAVTKQVPVERIKEALDAGVRDLGENRVQEMRAKMQVLPADTRWHMIGHLQTNKVKDVVGRVELLHSLDRWKLARAVDRQAAAEDVTVPVLVQVNVSGEESKFGISPVELQEFLAALKDLTHLRVNGLMTIAPYVDDPEEARTYFRSLRLLAEQVAGKVPGVSMEHLSMGMSNDYEVAVEEGATMVRLGSAIFGARSY